MVQDQTNTPQRRNRVSRDLLWEPWSRCFRSGQHRAKRSEKIFKTKTSAADVKGLIALILDRIPLSPPSPPFSLALELRPRPHPFLTHPSLPSSSFICRCPFLRASSCRLQAAARQAIRKHLDDLMLQPLDRDILIPSSPIYRPFHSPRSSACLSCCSASSSHSPPPSLSLPPPPLISQE